MLLTVEHLINDVSIRKSDLDRMLTVLDVVDKRGQLIVHEDDVAVLMQCHTERELAIIGFILQRHILPYDCESGA